MAKEETGRLLSKVAKFVRNPLKDWSELDTQEESVPADNGYSREMLKEIIERRQRNDFVRRREFDMLRKLRQREAAGGEATISSFDLSTSGKSEGRAITLKKIDEIEEQMSQQWWKGRGLNGGAPASVAAGQETPISEEAVAAHRARAYADTEPGVPPPSQEPAAATTTSVTVCEGVHLAGLEDAAIRFAQGDDAGAEAVLLQMTAPGNPHGENNSVWRALLDFYRVSGDAEKFGATSTRYAQRLRRPCPEWVSLRSLAGDAQMALDALPACDPAAFAAGSQADWHCPAQLSREGLAALTRALAAAGPVWEMDWRALESIDLDAAPPLRALFNHWADSPVQLRFSGAEQLLAVLAKATPMGERGVDVVWWQLRLAVLRAVHEPDMYELGALGYCITYEVSPPSWADPRGSYAAVASEGMVQVVTPPLASRAVLVGQLAGDCHGLLRRLDAELKLAQMPTVSCAALLRVDLEAARALIDWAADHEEQGRRIDFVDVHRLAAIFFHVMGITDHANVSPRSK